ncbi:BZ3500_MvSof-1268-A1-R1_Chr7-2g09546 [Microbotryum saponariae]|uniref:BZ3500_MvSof-1268-A1-R1_Chr7-2g09546 protein n=1 Tax=Microbotryum saponariae TaxID=289078 RepID=A0A2X0LTP1_9BASI|nr:BZ3500_MvSof-1268-A1-R1_Chr7-2g09546 [Microbotryum saponariae]
MLATNKPVADVDSGRKLGRLPSSIDGSAGYDVIPSDVACHTLPEPATDGERYIVTFIDDFSRKTWVSALRNKSQVFDTFQHWHAMIERSTGLKLRVRITLHCHQYSKDFFFLENVHHIAPNSCSPCFGLRKN